VSLGYVLVFAVGALVVALALPRAARRPERAGPRRRWVRIRPRRRRETTPDLASLDRLLGLAVANADDEHVRLRPLVTDLARQRLADHTGIRLDADPAGARAALGEDAWELVRPERPRPADRRGRGIAPDRLRAVVESLERIGPPA
jgi:hypothetical protein